MILCNYLLITQTNQDTCHVAHKHCTVTILVTESQDNNVTCTTIAVISNM